MNEQTSWDGAWALAYFRQLYEGKVDVGPQGVYTLPLTDEKVCAETLHLAWSRDGLRWTPLNGNQPTVPQEGRRWWLRDPFVGRGPDGVFHLVATASSPRPSVFYARSPDLINWTEPVARPLMESVPQVRNVWAPEWVWDASTDSFFLFWSSSFGAHGWDDSRLWYARTRDWETFSAPRVLFDPGFTVIDGTLTPFEGRWFLVFKDERFGVPHGEHRYLQVATADALDGPYTIQTGRITSGTGEGPALLPGPPGGPRWRLLYDRCHENSYAALTSDDLLHWAAVPDAETSFPHAARHGSAVRVTEAELTALRTAFGG